ncbi:MAG: hypothetical protein RPU91_13920 [Candidatus Sedimenticola sp. (ex Thyasira tokunagai)]
MKLIFIIILLTITLSVSADSSNKFVSVSTEFELTKPTEWHFVTAEEHLNNLKKVEMTDDEFKQLMLKYSTAPLVAMIKYEEPFNDLNPSFKVNIKPLGQLKGADPKQILGLFLPQFERLFKDFSLEQQPIDMTISGLNAGYMRINYSLAIPDGRTFPTTSELWIVPRGNYFFMIGAGTRQDEKTGSRDEIKEILSSIAM